MLSSYFKEKYKQHLKTAYTLYYDDLSEYGNPATATKIFYFIPGFDGVPGQIRFVIPSLIRKFGKNIYIKCLYLNEYSSQKAIWEKYTLDNCDKKKDVVAQDLLNLAKHHPHIHVIALSNGFYDFAYATTELAAIMSRLTLYWAACAPDSFLNNVLFNQMYKLNGFKEKEYRWAAIPSHNWLAILNPELARTYTWKKGLESRTFHIDDLITRFPCCKLMWFYISIDAMNAYVERCLMNIRHPLNIHSYALIASNDGFWPNNKAEDKIKILKKYLANPATLTKKNSHCWVAEPSNMNEFINLFN